MSTDMIIDKGRVSAGRALILGLLIFGAGYAISASSPKFISKSEDSTSAFPEERVLTQRGYRDVPETMTVDSERVDHAVAPTLARYRNARAQQSAEPTVTAVSADGERVSRIARPGNKR